MQEHLCKKHNLPENTELTQALRFENGDFETVVDGYEHDQSFLQDIFAIHAKYQSLSSSLKISKSKLADQECSQIDLLAKKHKQANICNMTSILDIEDANQQDICHCGCKRSKGEAIALCLDEQNLTFLGPGVILFFFFLKQIQLTVFLVFLIYGLLALLINISNSSFSHTEKVCLEKIHLDYYICFYTQISDTQSIMNGFMLTILSLSAGFLMSIIWIISMKFIKYLGDNKNEEIDQMLDSASDYTILINNLPSRQYSEKDLVEYINQIWETKKDVDLQGQDRQDLKEAENDHQLVERLKMKSIQLVYNMENTRTYINQIRQLSEAICGCFEDKTLSKAQYLQTFAALREMPLRVRESSFGDEASNNEFAIFPRLIKTSFLKDYIAYKTALFEIYTQLSQSRARFLQSSRYRKKLSTSCALLQFQTQEQKVQFLRHCSFSDQKNFIEKAFCNYRKFYFKGKEIRISRAAEPSDLNLVNCQKQPNCFRYLLIWAITIGILALSYYLILKIKSIGLLQRSSSYITSCTLQIFNRIIWTTLSYLVVYQENNTKTDAITSLMKKTIIAQAVNVIISPTISMIVTNNNYLYSSKGLSEMVLTYQFVMFFMMMLFYVFNPLFYFKKMLLCFTFTRNIIIRRLAQVVEKVDTFDDIRPVLKEYEGPEFPIAGGYVYMTTAIFHTLFYCYLQPTVIALLIINISGFYLIMKYLLFRRCKIPELTEVEVFDFIMFVMTFGSVFYGVGSLFFIILETISFQKNLIWTELIPSFLCIAFWFVSSLNPFNIFNTFFEYLLESTGYSQLRIRQKLHHNKMKSFRIDTPQAIPRFLEGGNMFFKRKIRRKESYYQHSNVKKLLNFEAQLKSSSVAVNDSKIISFCESFFKHEPGLKRCKRFSMKNLLEERRIYLDHIQANHIVANYCQDDSNNGNIDRNIMLKNLRIQKKLQQQRHQKKKKNTTKNQGQFIVSKTHRKKPNNKGQSNGQIHFIPIHLKNKEK